MASFTASTVVSEAISLSTRPAVRDVDDRQLGDDHVDDLEAGEGQRALLQDLVAAVLRRVLHRDDDPFRAGHQVHRAAHPLHHLAGDHPVRQVALLVHLERAEHGQVDVPASHHRERVGAAEIGAAGRLGDRLLAGVDEIRIDLVLGRKRTDAEQAVLRMQRDVHAGRDAVRHQRRHADPEVHVVAVAQLAGDTLHYSITDVAHSSLKCQVSISAVAQTALSVEP